MARKIIGAAFISLDGVMQAPGGPTEDRSGGFEHGGWLPHFFDDIVGQAVQTLFAGDYDLLLGRRTYDIFASYWPYVEGEAAEMGAAFTRANKYVLTRGDAPLEWENSHRVSGIDQLAEIKAGDGPDLVIQGSTTIYSALLKAGLLDRLTLMTFPVILGAGKRPFDESSPALSLQMIDQKVSPSGVVIATYEPAGDVAAGWAGPQVSSERETQRQRRISEGSW